VEKFSPPLFPFPPFSRFNTDGEIPWWVRAGIFGFNGDVQLGSGASVIAIHPGLDQKFDVGTSSKNVRDLWLGRDGYIRCGTGSAYGLIGGTLKVNTTAVGNVGGGADELIRYEVPANTLATNGDSLEILCAGTIAGTPTNSKTIRLLWGAAELYTTTSVAQATAADWAFRATIIRTGAATQKATCLFTIGSSTMTMVTKEDYSEPTEDLTLDTALRCEGTSGGSATDDVIQKFLKVMWHPGP
jgi:hypothetical protein